MFCFSHNLYQSIYCIFHSVLCPPGSYGVANGTCLQCPVGTYQPDEGSTECVECPSRLPYTEIGAVRESQCADICEFNHYFVWFIRFLSSS